MQVSIHRSGPNRPHISSDIYLFKEHPKDKTKQERRQSRDPASITSGNPEPSFAFAFPAQSRTSFPSFDEAVFSPREISPQEENSDSCRFFDRFFLGLILLPYLAFQPLGSSREQQQTGHKTSSKPSAHAGLDRIAAQLARRERGRRSASSPMTTHKYRIGSGGQALTTIR